MPSNEPSPATRRGPETDLKISFDALPAIDNAVHYNGGGPSAAIRVDGQIVGKVVQEVWRPESYDCVDGLTHGPWQVESIAIRIPLTEGQEVYERFSVPQNTRTWTREATGEVYEFACDGWKKGDLKYTRAAARDTLNRAKRWVRENAHRHLSAEGA